MHKNLIFFLLRLLLSTSLSCIFIAGAAFATGTLDDKTDDKKNVTRQNSTDASLKKVLSHSQAELIVNRSSLSASEEFLAGIKIQLKPQWHTYWNNPGDSGTAPQLQWSFKDSSGQEQATVTSKIMWPTPHRVEQSSLISFVYEGEVLLLQKIKLTATTTALPIELKAEWLVCQEICIPQIVQWKLELPVGRSLQQNEDLILENQKLLPKHLASQLLVQTNTQDWVVLKITKPKNFMDVDFFPAPETPLAFTKPTYYTSDNDIYVTVKKQKSDLNSIDGVLVLYDSSAISSAFQIQLPLNLSLWTWFEYFLAAFIGGLILNLMPCVLPVLSIKAFSLLKSSQLPQGQRLQEALGYILGIWFSFLTLAIALVLFKKAGQQLGWGFQLQSPLFVILMALLFTVLALAQLEVFQFSFFVPKTFSSISTSHRWTQSFFSGVLAVLVASPCTAPYMGAALGFALSQDTSVTILLFSALALGLASPYALLVLIPNAAKFLLPKPGPWMNTFKKIMAVPLLATALWLGWIAMQLTQSTTTTNSSSQLSWQKFDEHLLEQKLGQQKIFIDFTADWCLSCKVNERVSLENPQVVDALKQQNVLLLKADWTHYDPTITKWLEKFHRIGVPMYLYYDLQGHTRLLPEVITPSLVLETITD